MKVIFHEDFYQVYTSDPAAAKGRIEAVVEVIESKVDFITAASATEDQIAAIHSRPHIEHIKEAGLYPISALAAGAAIQAAEIGMTEPCFGLLRPPGHHASSGSAWGFCFFNNMAIAIEVLKQASRIETAYVLDFDLHYGDGNVNIMEHKGYITVCNVDTPDRRSYIDYVTREMENCNADVIGISAGFDNHEDDWGGLLTTEDYHTMGTLVKSAAERNKGGCFAILEGGYNHDVLGRNVMALIDGMSY
ncbi:MAG: histone deacetylase family protein [SAR324 cluster bacterium]|nr:histone deacetylase family protein [SAR324 cluster bacterium]